MTSIVISQPMFFPWRGIFEQINLADDFVHYDNVQLPLGRSFTNRVQLKAETGATWLTVPIARNGKQLIMDVQIDEQQQWRSKHLKMIHHLYRKAACYEEVHDIIQEIYRFPTSNLCEFNIYATERISNFLGLKTRFHRASEQKLEASKSEALLGIIRKYKAITYITGHGAKNYLDHEYFEREHVEVRYMDYQNIPHGQLFGEFTPYVSIIDLICNEGTQAREYLKPTTKPWREYINESK